MNASEVSKYIALGDSLAEGLGDESVKHTRGTGGWCDRLASLIASERTELAREFSYANLAIRGSKTRTITGSQIEAALQQAPDFVTVMTGANDMLSGRSKLVEIERQLTHGLNRLSQCGVNVILVNLVDPGHLLLASPLRKKAKLISQIINRVGARLSLPVVDLNSRVEFTNLAFWSQDLAHFSEAGHRFVANLVAEKIGCRYRWPLDPIESLPLPDRSPKATLEWILFDVVPLVIRRIRGKTSGDGLSAKRGKLATTQDFPAHWKPAKEDSLQNLMF